MAEWDGNMGHYSNEAEARAAFEKDDRIAQLIEGAITYQDDDVVFIDDEAIMNSPEFLAELGFGD